ncbi:MAG TPA: tetratricopeptide repeat protein, partial [Roseiflexaceae bacterium]
MASMSLQAAYDQARQWLESNDLNRAIGLAQYILEQYPDNLDAYRILGEAYLANRQLDRAQESFERVLRSDPENIPAHVGLGITYERQGRLDRAVPEFEQALEIKPDMPELRSQLLRLYTDAWGSEHAHLRLSRAGLARLYAKGHMLPQAISEFRQVIAEQPNRFDAMVAMAEALWRDGQEDAAIAVCRDILAKRPESLKANLILGYLEMAAGHPEGEQAWAATRRMDPYQVVAHAIFDTLPPETDQEPMIEEWDEAAWNQRRAEEEQERVAATRPMEAVTPVAIAAAAAGTANGSRGAPPPPRPAPTPASDDFLAGLLAINTPPAPPPPLVTEPEEDFDLDLGMAPFSLDDLDSERSAPPAPATPAAMPQDEPTMAPFSLSDLGLSDDEIASLGAPTAPAAAAPSSEEEDMGMAPFSLSDLGLSDDEIAGLGSLGTGSESLPERPVSGSAAASDTTSEPPHGTSSGSNEEAFEGSGLPVDLQPFSLD